MKGIVRTSFTLAVSLLIAGTASADTKSWTAVKKVIGARGDDTVIGIDVTQLRSTAAFKAGLDLFAAEEPDAMKIFDTIKSDCGIDVTTAVSDITVVMRETEKPLIAVGLAGVDEAKIVSCLGTVAGKMFGGSPVTLTGKKKGKLTEYSVVGEPKKLYVAWLAADVFAFTDDPNDKALITKRLSGRGATGDLKKFIARTSPTAAFWFAVAHKEKEDGRTILGGHGKVELSAGVYKASGAIVMSKPAEATSMAAEGMVGLAAARTEVAKSLPELAKALATVTITAAAAEVVITGSVADADVVKIVPQLDKAF